MKISLAWLSDFVPGELDPRAVADTLTAGGLNVETIENSSLGPVLDVEVTSNRADCLCHLGIAREVAALMNRPFQDLKLPQSLPASADASPISVQIDSPELCPHYTARLIRGVKVRPSPPQMAQRLQAVGLRPINNVVDVTNYILMEMGQPLHAFDFALIRGGRIVVRQAANGEKITTIDGRQQILAPSMLVIADQGHPLAVAGVMGGNESEVTDATVDILLESARFDPLSVRRTSRALATRSESSYRFERGIDPTLPARASLRAAQLILETAGGTIASDLVAAGSESYQPKTLCLRLGELKRILGFDVPSETVIDVLTRLRLSPRLDANQITVPVPSYRADLNIEADLVEEIARVAGYDRIPLRDEISIRLTSPDPAQRATETIRQTLVSAGYFEAVTFSFVSDALRTDFLPTATDRAPLQADPSVRKADATLRPSLLPGLLESVRHNETAGTLDAHLFEIGSTFLAAPDGSPVERRRLALVGGADWRNLRGSIETLLSRLDADKKVRFIPSTHPGLAAGATARVEWDNKPIGIAGKIDPAVAAKLSLLHTPMAAELELPELLSAWREVPNFHNLAQFPAARRDLSLIVDQSVPFERIEKTVLDLHLPDLEQIEFVTTYRGKPLDADKKSVTITLLFRSPTTTLTSEQVEDRISQTTAAVREKLGATLRQ
jgi:phenylalanyl-tRNA synthetase beta chain